MLCVLGDILNYGPRNGLPEGLDAPGIARRLNSMADDIVAVRGNCDSEVDQMLLHFPMMADYAVLVDNDKRLFLTHGHVYNDQQPPPCRHDTMFFGHTHLWCLERQDDTVICNIGSITFPKDGREPTFASYADGTIRVHRLDGEVLKSLEL